MNYVNPPVYDFIVSFDFDGTLFEEGYWPKIGPSIEDIQEVVHYCHDQGYIIVLNTLREGQPLDDATNKLVDLKLPIHMINCNVPHRVLFFGNQRKIGAEVYVDDRNAGGLLTKDEYIRAIDYKFMQHNSRLLFKEEIDAIAYAYDNEYKIDETHFWSHLEDELECISHAVVRGIKVGN